MLLGILQRKSAVAIPAALSGLLLSSPVCAGSAPGHITGILPTNYGTVFFNDDGARMGSPSCASGNPVRWVFNANTPAGQALLSTLLTAYSLGRMITVTDAGTCDVDSSTESVAFFFIDD